MGSGLVESKNFKFEEPLISMEGENDAYKSPLDA